MPDIFRALLAKEPDRDMEFSPDEIHLGKIGAPFHVTLIMGVYCRPCADEKVLKRWLVEYQESLWITVRFLDYSSSSDETKMLIDSLTTIYLQSGKNTFLDSFLYWYEIYDIQKFKEKFNISVSTIALKLSSKNARWQREQYINYSPAIFVGGRLFQYMLEDLEYLVKEY